MDITLDVLCQEFYEDLNGQIVKVAFVPGRATIDFDCDHWKGEKRLQLSFVCESVQAASIYACDGVGSICWSEEDPLLLEYRYPRADLYCSSKPKSIEAAIFAMAQAHENIYAKLEPAPPFSYTEFREILEAGYGCLAKGPLPLIEAYETALRGLMDLSKISSSGQLLTDVRALSFDEKYVICERVTVRERHE